MNGNGHVHGVRRASASQARRQALEQRRAANLAKSPEQRQAERKAGVVGAIFLLVLISVIIVGVVVAKHATHSAYNDGYQWGLTNSGPFTPVSCLESQMSAPTDTEVTEPNFAITMVPGDGEPNDNFDQWQAGCQAGAQKSISGR